MSGSDGSKAEDDRTTVLVSALRLTLGLATLPLLSLGLLVTRGERALQPASEREPTDPQTSAQPTAERFGADPATEQADSAALPARADVDAALQALTMATLPRAGRRAAARASRPAGTRRYGVSSEP